MIQEIKDGAGWTWELADIASSNSLGPTMAACLHQSCNRIEQHWSREPQQTRYLMIKALPSGRQKQVWISGGHLRELALLTEPAQGRAYASSMADVLDRFARFPFPVIMCVDGRAIGGGAEFSLGGDIRLATRASSWDFRQAKIGLTTGYRSCQRIVNLIGLSRAQFLLLQGGEVESCEALSMGLTQELCDDRVALLARAHEIAQKISLLSYQAVAGQKAMLQIIQEQGAAGGERELDIFASLWMGPAHREALAQFENRSK